VVSTNAEDIRRQIQQTSTSLGHDGFLYLYFQDGRIRAVGDLSIAALAPLLINAITKTSTRQ